MNLAHARAPRSSLYTRRGGCMIPARSSLRPGLSLILVLAAVVVFVPLRAGTQESRTLELHMNALVLDTHVDTPQRMLFEKGFDIGERHTNGNLDIPRMREGGLDAVFMSIWVPSAA